MIELNKRWSTWLNYIAGILAACLSFIPQLGFEIETSAKIMLACTVIIHIAQRTKQKGGKNGTDTSKS